ncbi:hypothetical protein LINPERHAP1_LOCUS26027 [Linum perenne]
MTWWTNKGSTRGLKGLSTLMHALSPLMVVSCKTGNMRVVSGTKYVCMWI